MSTHKQSQDTLAEHHRRHDLQRIVRSNVATAQLRWGPLPTAARRALKELTNEHHLVVEAGDILLLIGC